MVALVSSEPPAPYKPSGWKPSGPAFTLPNEQKQPAQYLPPQQQFGPLEQQYGPPDQQYGPPDQQYGPPIKQELPKPNQEKPFQEYNPRSNVQPSFSWQIPEEKTKFLPNEPSSWQQYGPPEEQTTTQQPEQQNTEEDEQNRVLEQIRQYKLNVQRQQLRQQQRQRANLQNLPKNYDVPQRLRNNEFRSGRLQQQEQEIQNNEGDESSDDSYEPKEIPQILPRRKYGPPNSATQRPQRIPTSTTTQAPDLTTEVS